jgi:uncharacterized damage-inducible protein DinB
MNAELFRQLYNYHFSENRALWDRYIVPLSQEQFTQPNDYSVGSVRNQIVHIMTVDDAWFGDLRGLVERDDLEPADTDDRAIIRARWDVVEAEMRAYLAALTDDMLTTQPLSGEDDSLFLWQVLMQVFNHATDHRAQLLRQLNDLGVKTGPQDYIFYVYDNL